LVSLHISKGALPLYNATVKHVCVGGVGGGVGGTGTVL
jgi:hypothetical protein